MRQVAILLTLAALVYAERGTKAKLAPPRPGVKTPGVQVPFEKLKSEAEIELKAPATALLFTDAVYVQLPESIAKFDAKTNKAADGISGLKRPCSGMVSAFGGMWTPGCGEGNLLKIDPKSSKITATIDSGAAAVAKGIAATADSIWMLTDDRMMLSRIDPETSRVVAELRLPRACDSLTFGEDSLWLACANDNQVLRINPQTNLVVKRIGVAAGPKSLVVAEGSVWVFCETDGKVSRIDPKTDTASTAIDLAAPKLAGSITAGGGSIWVSQNGLPLTRIDPGAGKVIQQFYGTGGGVIHFGLDSLWMAVGPKLVRIDPKRAAATFAE